MKEQKEPGGKAAEAWLAKSAFFSGLARDTCRTLAARCRLRRLRKREPLFHEGDAGRALYLLIGGSIQLLKATADGREVVIRTIQPGETFAEVILEPDTAYPVSAIALAASELIELARADVFRLLDTPRVREDFIAFLMRKQRYLAERVRYLTAYDVEERFIRFLREHYGRRDPVRVTLSKRDLAAAIGATPETLSRLIQRLSADQGLRWTGRALHVPPALWDKYATT